MASFSFDIVSEIDKAEMNNVFMQVEKELAGRYDFRGTVAKIEWLDNKQGFRLVGDNEWQVEAILDILRKRLAAREQSSRALDLTKEKIVANLKTTWEIPFKAGLVQSVAKKITADIRNEAFKAKPQVQGEAVRVVSASKDELQKVMVFIKQQDYDIPLQFTNYR